MYVGNDIQDFQGPLIQMYSVKRVNSNAFIFWTPGSKNFPPFTGMFFGHFFIILADTGNNRCDCFQSVQSSYFLP